MGFRALSDSFEPSLRQREAIEAPLGPMLVVAGPGAGKTFCLIERIRFLIERKHLDPTRICAVTFTNKAAQEIAERLDKALGERGRGVKGGTLHALCAEILREHGEPVGARRGFGIADDDYQRDLLRRLGVFPASRHGGLLTRFGLHRVRGTALTEDDQEVFARYRHYLERHNLLDFDDLVHRTARLLTADDRVAALVADRWDYILVDEFQDLNPLQYAVVKRLARDHRNLFAVGDDEQSVFSWTGADPEVLRQFLNDFGISDLVILDENRRTAHQIFATARRLLTRNPTLFDQKVISARRTSAFEVAALDFEDEHDEVRWLLADLRRDQAEAVLPWGEYGVLYRRHEIGDALESEFIRAGIPCRMSSGHALQDDPVVRYLVAALRVIAEPGDPLREEAFARGVLPVHLWATIVSEADRRKVPPIEWMATMAAQRDKRDEEGRKLWRARFALQNLPALARKHTTLSGLVEELLSQRVGEYRTVLEDRHDALSDPADHPAVAALAGRISPILHGRGRVWLPRMGGLEIALNGLLLGAGVTSVAYAGGAGHPSPDDLTIGPEDAGPFPLALTVFKALQLVHTGALRDAFRDFVAVDVETTDRDTATCEIIDLAAVRVRDGRVVAEYHQRIKPFGPVSEGARKVHGITDAELEHQPRIHAVWPQFREFCGADILVAHNGNRFDFPILRRIGADLRDAGEFVTFDTLPLARDLHPASRRQSDLAHFFGIEVRRAHQADDDARVLAQVFLRLQKEKLARARKTSLVHLLDYLGLALALSDPAQLTGEAGDLWKIAKTFALGRYSDCLEFYRFQRADPDAFDAPTPEAVLQLLGGARRQEELRRGKTADDRYPGSMARLRRLLDMAPEAPMADQLREFLNRVALSKSDADRDLDLRVNLLTLHATKGLEFSRVYIIGAEDDQMPGIRRDGSAVPELEIQEGRRLLYVGMTRTKDRLVMTRVQHRKGLPTGGFRFLEEMGLKPVTAP